MNEFDIICKLRDIARKANNPDVLNEFDAMVATYLANHDSPPPGRHPIWDWVPQDQFQTSTINRYMREAWQNDDIADETWRD